MTSFYFLYFNNNSPQNLFIKRSDLQFLIIIILLNYKQKKQQQWEEISEVVAVVEDLDLDLTVNYVINSFVLIGGGGGGGFRGRGGGGG